MDYADTIKARQRLLEPENFKSSLKSCLGVNLQKTCFCNFILIERFIGSDFTMFKLIEMFQLPKISQLTLFPFCQVPLFPLCFRRHCFVYFHFHFFVLHFSKILSWYSAYNIHYQHDTGNFYPDLENADGRTHLMIFSLPPAVDVSLHVFYF